MVTLAERSPNQSYVSWITPLANSLKKPTVEPSVCERIAKYLTSFFSPDEPPKPIPCNEAMIRFATALDNIMKNAKTRRPLLQKIFQSFHKTIGFSEATYLPFERRFDSISGYIDSIRPEDLGDQGARWFIDDRNRIGFSLKMDDSTYTVFQRYDSETTVVSYTNTPAHDQVGFEFFESELPKFNLTLLLSQTTKLEEVDPLNKEKAE